MEQLVIVLIIAAVSLVKWLMEKSAEARAKADTAARMDEGESPRPIANPWNAPRPTATPLQKPQPPANDASRRLREALGLPPESTLPIDEPRPTPVPPPVPSAVKVKKMRPLAEIAADLEQRVVTAPKAPAPKSFAPPPPVVPAASATASARTTMNELLNSRDGLRKAILAQEILGTPKGLVF